MNKRESKLKHGIEKGPHGEGSMESAVALLAIFLCSLTSRGVVPPGAVGGYIESVLALAKAAGVSKANACYPFDVYPYPVKAEQIWDELK